MKDKSAGSFEGKNKRKKEKTREFQDEEERKKRISNEKVNKLQK